MKTKRGVTYTHVRMIIPDYDLPGWEAAAALKSCMNLCSLGKAPLL